MWGRFIGGGANREEEKDNANSRFDYVSRIAKEFMNDGDDASEENWRENSDENEGWNEDDLDDLEQFSDAQSDHDDEKPSAESETNRKSLNKSSETTPPDSSVTLQTDMVAGKLDHVLHEIEEQEKTSEHIEETFSSDEDAEHLDQAVQDIQHELQSVDDKSIVDTIPNEDHIVDHTPPPNIGSLDGGPEDTGVLTLPDTIDDENEQNFGPVVDHLPDTKKVPLNRHDSLAVQANDIPDDDDDTYEFELKINLPKTLQEHMVDHTPEVEVKPNGSVSVAVLASLGEDENLEPKEYGPMVDHLPVDAFEEKTGSLAVGALELSQDIEDDEAMDETLFGDSTVEGLNPEGWDDASEDVSIPIKRATFSPQLVYTRHLVDYIPEDTDGMPDNRDPSVIAVATIGEISKESEENNDNESEFGPVVDHTPQTPAEHPKNASASVENTNSLAVDPSALEEEYEEDSAMSDDSSENGWEEKGDGWDAKLEEKDDNEWDSKLPAQREDAIVDHTPSEIGSPGKRINGDPSIEVQASEGNTRDDNMDENEVYGPVVDLTPTTPTPAAMARSDSVVVNVPENDLDTVDETTVLGGENEAEHEHATDGSDDDGGDKMVDFIPARSESRYADGSTFAAADPSEYLSVVDDLAPENQNFGPVVDLTPPTRPVAASEHTLGEDSTAVFAPASVAADDLDQELEQDDGETNQRSEWEEGQVTPNPQSGNDEPVNIDAVNEQLVDFLPPQNDEVPPDAIDDGNREGLSEMTVGGAASLLQGGDPVEADFGPVVDQIPAASAQDLASIATQVTASECRSMARDDKMNGTDDASIDQVKESVVVDRLPTADAKRLLDSTATIGRSLLSEEEEEEDASKFGPVVDQLPTSRASLAPSRGGSTVDALGTLSEAPSDDEGDGWDDDYDASVSESTERGLSSVLRQTLRSSVAASSNDADRSVSVRFEDSRSIEETSVSKSKTGIEDDRPMKYDARYYDPEQFSTSESQFYDPSSGWDEDSGMKELSKFHETEMPDKSFAEADTPPSTPYRRPVESFEEDGHFNENGSIDVPVLRAIPHASVAKCLKCDSAKTADCPCVRRLIESSLKEGSILGSIKTADGESVSIDFGQMLEDEITRRRLLEVELENLKSGMEPQDLQDSLQAAKESEMEKEIAELRHSSDALRRKITSAESESTRLRMENARLGHDLEASRAWASDLEQSKESLEAKGAAFKTEIETLRQSLEESSACDLSNGDIGIRLVELQSQLASKTGECSELGTKVTQLERRLADAEELSLQQAKESAEVSTLMKQTISSLKDQIAGSDELILNTEKARLELEKKLDALDDEVTNLRSSSKHVAELQIQHESDLQQQYLLLDKKTSDLRALEKLVSQLQTEKATMMADLAQQRALADQSESLANELLSVAKERDLLEASLRESKEAMLSLQKLMEAHGSEREALDLKREEEKDALKADLEEVRRALSTKEKELSCISDEIASLSLENESLTAQVEQSTKAKNEAEAAIDIAKLKADKQDEELLSREAEIERLTEELNNASSDRSRLEKEVKDVTAQLTDIQEAVDNAQQMSKQKGAENSDLQRTIAQLQSDFTVLSDERNALTTERDDSVKRCSEAEQKYAVALAEFDKKSEELTRGYNEDLAKLKEGSDLLQKEVSQLQEAEQLHAKSLKELLQNTQEEERLYEKTKLDLRAECDGLREELSRLEASEAANGRALEELKINAKKEIEELRKEAAMHKELYEKADIPLQEMKYKLEELTREHESEIMTLKDEIEQLLGELSMFEELKSQQTRSLEELESKSEDHRQLTEEVAKLQTECNKLRAELDEREGLADDLAAERLRLQDVVSECDVLREENEELLVQFGLLKQKMDESDEHVSVLHAEIEALQTEQSDKAMAELESLRSKNAELDSQVATSFTERESLMQRVAELENSIAAVEDEKVVLQASVQDLEARSSSLLEDCDTRRDEIDRLNKEIHKISGLEIAKKSAEETIAQCKEEINSLEGKLAKLSTATEEKEFELESLRSKLEEQQTNHDKQLAELQRRSSALDEELQAAREKVVAADAASESKKRVMDLMNESEKQIEKLESQLAEKDAAISMLQANMQVFHKTLDESASATREAATEKSKEIVSLQKQIDVLSDALQNTRTRLASKEQDVDRLSAEVRSIQSQQTKSLVEEYSKASKALSADVDMLRHSVIARAAKLKRSEKSRAEAMKRLEEERRANNESLRLLKQSVERYYAPS